MPIRFPTTGSWQQKNASDKEADLFYVENINFDERGYAKLSPRMVRAYSDNDDNDFGLPIAIGRTANGEYQICTNDKNWQADISLVAKTFTEDSDGTALEPTFEGDAVWFGGLWHISGATAVKSRVVTGGASQEYVSRITGLTDGPRHLLKVFGSRISLVVSNGNVLKQYSSAYANTTDLTLPSDFEISGLAYNAGKMGVITRLTNNGTLGQDAEAVFFIWNGAGTGSNGDSLLGSDAGVGIGAYGSSFLVLTRSGELKYWNGGGFQTVAFFPFWNTEHIWNDPQSNNALGQVHMKVDGDTALIHVGNELNVFGAKQENYIEQFPAGIWCFDPRIGLTHRYSLSNSPAYVYEVTGANTNTGTDVMTISAGTVPATGNVARLLQTVGIGGLTANTDYYIIKTGTTTFKLATSREYAEAGIAIDLTSATTGSNYFLMVDHRDFGASRYDTPGAVALTGDRNMLYTDVIAGARLYDLDLSSVDMLSIAVPGLENRGVLVFPKIFAPSIQDTPQKFVVRYRPLGPNDSILVKVRNKDVYGIPVGSGTNYITWTGLRDAYTTVDLSEAKTYLDNGGSLEMKLTGGAGAGTRIFIESISENAGTYALVLKEDVFGVTAGNKSYFHINNWALVRTITSADTDGYVEVTELADTKSSKFVQVQLELRGHNVTIEDAYYQEVAHQ